MKNKLSIHSGHRQRMIERFRQGGLKEHEYLEMLLFNGLPRKNTNELAHRLLAHYTTVVNLVKAPLDQIARIEGVGINIAMYIKLFGEAFSAYQQQEGLMYNGAYDKRRFSDFLKNRFKSESFEVFELYFLDTNRNVYFSYRIMGESNHSVTFAPEEFARLLVETGPAGVIIVHNHPLGTADPSLMDDETTKRCQVICSAHNVLLCDHIICGTDRLFSYYDSGKLKNMDDLLI